MGAGIEALLEPGDFWPGTGGDGRPDNLEVEVVYDEVSSDDVTSHSERHTIRVRSTKDQADLVVNETALPWVSAQQAAVVVEQAIARRDTGDVRGARRLVAEGIAQLQAYGRDLLTADALRLLQEAQAHLANDADYARSRKSIRYSSSTYKRMRSREHWVGEGPAPSFVKSPQKKFTKPPKPTA